MDNKFKEITQNFASKLYYGAYKKRNGAHCVEMSASLISQLTSKKSFIYFQGFFFITIRSLLYLHKGGTLFISKMFNSNLFSFQYLCTYSIFYTQS